ncbi:hypothetical protein [Pseudomonas asiatica]|uniref:hypothetical protein n=1 Tax=Pseudomonas asiatica TaxID=2219225 RepID=UPI003F5AF2F9
MCAMPCHWCWKTAWSASTPTTSSTSPSRPNCCWTTRRCASPLAIKAPDGRPLARLASLEVSETSVDLVKQLVTVGKIRSENWKPGPRWKGRPARLAETVRQPAGQGYAEGKAEPAAAEPTPEQQAAKEPSKPWQVLLKDATA